ncbi:hypothetical protein GOV11_01970 [Candidatus Woesearchaeota archaeon]|nr:hypothetical protein [Candidatus Woesearchaeota archaeon]
MAFDPSSIKKPRLLPEHLDDDSSREDHIAALANQLHDRGITASLADAKRLAEGMVDTERRVIRGSREDPEMDQATLRKTVQSGALFDAVLNPEERFTASLPEDFRRFVEKASEMREPIPEHVKIGPSIRSISEEDTKYDHQVFYSDSPGTGTVRGFKEQEYHRPIMPDMVESPSDVEPEETPETVEDEGFVDVSAVADLPKKEPEKPEVDLSKVFYTGSGNSEAVEEQPVQEETPEPKEEPEPEKKPERKLPEEDIDLFDIFKSG